MKFSEIIREAGVNPETFPEASKADVRLYGDDDLNIFNNDEVIDNSEHIHFAAELFAENPAEKENFLAFLRKFENSTVDSFDVRIDPETVTVFYKTPHHQTFLRKEPMHPMDYMD